MIKVLNRQTGKEILMEGSKTVTDILRELNLVETSVLIIRDGELLTRDMKVHDGQTVELIPVISGG